MVPYYLPIGMRYTTLEERKHFYTEEFSAQKAAEWFSEGLGTTKFAVVMGRHTKIFLQKYRSDSSTTVVIDKCENMEQIRGQIIEFLPEAVYYDRNLYDENEHIVGQELAFDLDPENITCPIHGTLADKMKRLQGLSFCEVELGMVKTEAIGLFGFLSERFGNIRIVYSGRGYHLHVLEPNAYMLSIVQKLQLAKEVREAGFHIDEWVTSGEMRLIRLPYSLNGLVSRIVLPLTEQDLKTFDPVHDPRCLPQFLGKEATTF